eukprot:IDg23697t1
MEGLLRAHKRGHLDHVGLLRSAQGGAYRPSRSFARRTSAAILPMSICCATQKVGHLDQVVPKVGHLGQDYKRGRFRPASPLRAMTILAKRLVIPSRFLAQRIIEVILDQVGVLCGTEARPSVAILDCCAATKVGHLDQRTRRVLSTESVSCSAHKLGHLPHVGLLRSAQGGSSRPSRSLARRRSAVILEQVFVLRGT